MFLVAVVDDDPGILKGLSSLLRSEGYSVETFFSAESFLASAASHSASFLVTDVQLPGIDGIALQATMRAKRPCLPVMVMTAFGDAVTRGKAMAGGAIDILVKPFATERLLDQIALAARDGRT